MMKEVLFLPKTLVWNASSLLHSSVFSMHENKLPMGSDFLFQPIDSLFFVVQLLMEKVLFPMRAFPGFHAKSSRPKKSNALQAQHHAVEIAPQVQRQSDLHQRASKVPFATACQFIYGIVAQALKLQPGAWITILL